MLEAAFLKCRGQGTLLSQQLPDFVVEVPRTPEHGDLATNLAMLLAQQEKKPPRQIAQALLSCLADESALIARIDIAGPGFINFRFKETVWHQVLCDIAAQGARYGASDMGRGQKVMVEFVSANPTGPLHIGHGRGAALGDALANILAYAGYAVEREYYINDVGNQMQSLGRSVYIRYLQLLKQPAEFSEGLYKGDYIIDIAKEVILKHGNAFLQAAEQEAVAFFTAYAAQRILKGIQDDLQAFGVHLTTWFSEKSLFDSGDVQHALHDLKSQGLAYELDGALWFKATQFGDEKDRVMVKENGSTTYFASDIAYHQNKFKRGFDKTVDIWGADHHGYVPRIKSVLSALGIAPDALHVILVQMVNLLRDGTPVAMSTRAGEFVTLKQVVEEVGADAARFIFLTRRSDAQLDFDLGVAKKQSDENPVYYVQYGHARTCSIISFAAEQGLAVPAYQDIDARLLSAPEEIDLMRKLAQFPWTVAGSAQAYEPHRLTTYLLEIVAQFHSYYNKYRVITEQQNLSRARLLLMDCIRKVLHNGMSLVGVAAPEKM